MIEQFIEAFDEHKPEIKEAFSSAHPDTYLDIVKTVVQFLPSDNDWSDGPDPERIVEIDHGDYQGTLLYVVGAKGYQPSHYWYVKVDYGSCSGCDTLESIRSYSGEPPTPEQINDYLTLALHIVQGIKPMQEELPIHREQIL